MTRLRRLLRWFSLRRVVRLALFAVVTVIVTTGFSVLWVRAEARGHLYTEGNVPEAPVALVLGAQVYPDGNPSPFLAARLAIAQRLLEAGKIKAILVSGDHREWKYDEPGAMTRWLTDHGVPAAKIAQDHAGFDTYDSCVRAHKIFGVERAIVVTQSYHIARAVTLCRRLGVEADGVGDDSVRQFHKPWRISATREYGACVKAVVDVTSGRDPVFLGRREVTVDEAMRA
jgi:vancomycin permeability regulator SanA